MIQEHRSKMQAISERDYEYANLASFRRRVDHALSVIKQASEKGTIGVSFSGGKDSTVVRDLVLRVAPDSPVAFFDSGAELKQTRETIDFYKPLVFHPKHSFIDLLEAGGYWGSNPEGATVKHNFLKLLILDPARQFVESYSLVTQALGLRSCESNIRAMTAYRRGELFQLSTGIWRLSPIAFWSDDDVWAYIASRNLRYNAAYDLMTELGVERKQQRISTFFGSSAATIGRYAIMKRLDPELWNRMAAKFPRITIYG